MTARSFGVENRAEVSGLQLSETQTAPGHTPVLWDCFRCASVAEAAGLSAVVFRSGSWAHRPHGESGRSGVVTNQRSRWRRLSLASRSSACPSCRTASGTAQLVLRPPAGCPQGIALWDGENYRGGHGARESCLRQCGTSVMPQLASIVRVWGPGPAPSTSLTHQVWGHPSPSQSHP